MSRMKPLSTAKKGEQNKKIVIAGSPIYNEPNEIGKLLNQAYQREYLADKVTRNAMEFHHSLNLKPRSQHTNSSQIRNNIISKNIMHKNLEEQLEALRHSKAE